MKTPIREILPLELVLHGYWLEAETEELVDHALARTGPGDVTTQALIHRGRGRGHIIASPPASWWHSKWRTCFARGTPP